LLSDNGQTAAIMLGVYFQLDDYESVVPITSLSVVNGNLTLRTRMAEAQSSVAR